MTKIILMLNPEIEDDIQSDVSLLVGDVVSVCTEGGTTASGYVISIDIEGERS